MDHFTEFQSIIAAVYKEDQLPLSHFVDDTLHCLLKREI